MLVKGLSTKYHLAECFSTKRRRTDVSVQMYLGGLKIQENCQKKFRSKFLPRKFADLVFKSYAVLLQSKNSFTAIKRGSFQKCVGVYKCEGEI